MDGGDSFLAEHEAMVRGIANDLAAENGLKRDVDDLVAFGFEGLLEARRRFDPSRETPFAAFAYYRVRWAILDGVRQMGLVPWNVRRSCQRAALLDACAEQMGEQQPPPDPADGPDAIARTIDAMMSGLAMATLASAAAQETQTDPEAAVISEHERARVRKAVSALPPREARVLWAVYFEELVLDDVGSELRLSRSAVSRIHTRGLDLLREQLQ